MGRPKAEIKPSQEAHVRRAVAAHRQVLAARAALREAEAAYRDAVVGAVDDGDVVPTALARELGITSQAIRDLMRRHAEG